MPTDNDLRGSGLPVTQENPSHRLLQILAEAAFGHAKRHQQAQTIVQPFFIREKSFNALELEVLEHFSKIDANVKVRFSGSVRFGDISSESFDEYDYMRQRLGNRADPEAAFLE